MTLVMGLADLFEKLLTEHASPAVLEKHVALFRDAAQALEKKVVELEQENTRLKERVNELERQILAQATSEEFVEYRGALFKRTPDGRGYLDTVYCFDCHRPMSSARGVLPYRCKCGFVVDFAMRDLFVVMEGLPKPKA
jgi:hypothetical protein